MPDYINNINNNINDNYQSKLKFDFNDSKSIATMRAILDATPLCVNLWNSRMENIMCNKRALELFDISTEKIYLEEFFNFSTKVQPDGTLAVEASVKNMQIVREKGVYAFPWLHCKLNGEEIPSEVTLIKIEVLDEFGEEMVVGFTRDLRSQIAGTDITDFAEGFFHNHVSYRKLFETMTELSDEWFYVFDIRDSLMTRYGNGSNVLGITNKHKKYPDYLLEANMVYEEDMSVFLQFCEELKTGFVAPRDFRFVLKGGDVRFYRSVFKTICDKSGKPIYSIGKTFDINEQKAFEKLSQTDLLTNCYNKVTSENLIRNVIASSKRASHAMFIVDIDDFKAVNDNLGHHFGDLVLSNIASNLHSQFRDDDIIGRIGGDEFIVFVKNIGDISIVEAKAKAIAKAFKNTYSGENKDYKVSGSIGISIYKKDGNTYEDLYKAADKALYQSKLSGKDRYTFYSEELIGGTMKNRTVLENANRIAQSMFDTELVSMVFDLLYETNEIESSINGILRYIGKRANADRCYIFQTFNEGKTYDNTYEWCKRSITPEIDNLQGLTNEILADFFEDADGDGVIYSNDLSVLDSEGAYELMFDQGIKSFLHAQTRDKGYVKMFLGLDDCTNTRVWGEKEINSLVYAAKMISIFLNSEIRKKLTVAQNIDYSGFSSEEIAVIEKLKKNGILVE